MQSKSIARVFLAICIALNSFAQNSLQELSNERVWKSLLFYDGSKSDITDPTFFLYKKKNWTPQKELEATVRGYSAKIPNNPNKHPRCLFPARYFWLQQFIPFPNYEVIPPFCKELRKSLVHNRIDSISLIVASSYLGNPASSFGHSFIKLNRSGYRGDLLDYTINYGAKVPEDENIFRYIFRGVFGLYKAHFQDRFFYSQDFVYSNIEKRDVWEYRLKLTPRELLFLQLHIWEILNKDFKYLFFTKNCGYEVAKTLEIVLPSSIDTPLLWYAPKESVYALQQMEKIESYTYHPSASKRLYAHYKKLDRALQKLVHHHLPQEYKKLLQMPLEPEKKTELIQFLLAYYNYKSLKIGKKYKKEKYEIIKARFFLPPTKHKHLHISQTPPHLTSKLSKFQFLLQEGGFQSRYTPYYVSPLAFGEEIDHEMVVLDMRYARKFSKHDFSIDFLKVSQYEGEGLPFEEERSFSWRLKLAYDKRLFLDFGIGKTVLQRANDYLFYILPHLVVQKKPQIDFETGLFLIFDKLRIKTSYDSSEKLAIEANYFFTADSAFTSHYKDHRFAIGFTYFF